MKRLTVIFFMLGLMTALPAQDSAQQETQAGDFIFKLPAGWKRVDQGAKTFLEAPSPSETPTAYLVLQGFDLGNNDLQTTFNVGWQALAKGSGLRSTSETVSQHSPNGFDYLYTTGTGDANGKHWAAVFMGAKYGERFETVLFLTSEPPGQNQSYMKSLEDFLNSVRFGPAPAASQANHSRATAAAGSAPPANFARSIERDPAAPASGPMSRNNLASVPGKFAGIFRAAAQEGGSTSTSREIFDPSRNTPDYQFLVLFSDGTAMRGLPIMGLDDYVASVRLDIAGGGASCAKWGVYRMSGNQGRIFFASPAAAGQQLVSGRFVGDSWNVQEYADKLQINGNDYIPLDGGTAGMKLNGTFKPFGDKKQPGITFTRDGEFIDEGILKTGGATAVGVVGGGFAIGYAFSSPGPGRGMYRISNYTLHLNYANGQAPGVLFWLDPATSRADVRAIYLGNVKLQRVP
ncbi:MAG TPA: hypothetical protein VI488_17880 [Candidatus Angelobacter sp.]